jgi:hypothetical protein
MVANNLVYAEMAAKVQSRASQLRRMSFAELGALPEVDSGDIEVMGQRVLFTVYRTVRNGEELLVVVQAARDRYFGLAKDIRVEGFLANPSGERVEAPEKLLWEYT